MRGRIGGSDWRLASKCGRCVTGRSGWKFWLAHPCRRKPIRPWRRTVPDPPQSCGPFTRNSWFLSISFGSHKMPSRCPDRWPRTKQPGGLHGQVRTEVFGRHAGWVAQWWRSSELRGRRGPISVSSWGTWNGTSTFPSMFHPWYVSTASKGKKDFNVPVPDQAEFPAEIKRYTECKWRGPDMCLLDFLRKSNEEGGIAGWLKEKWQKDGQGTDLTSFAQGYVADGEKIVACAMGSRLRDKYFWAMVAVACSFQRTQSIHGRTWSGQSAKNRQVPYGLFGLFPSSGSSSLEQPISAGRGHVERRAWRTLSPRSSGSRGNTEPLGARLHEWHIPGVWPPFAQPIQDTQKTASIGDAATVYLPNRHRPKNSWRTSSQVQIQVADLLQVGDLTLEVEKIETFPSFRQMLQHVGYLQALPNAQSLDEAVSEYLSVLAKKVYTVERKARPSPFQFWPLPHNLHTKVFQDMPKTSVNVGLWPFTWPGPKPFKRSKLGMWNKPGGWNLCWMTSTEEAMPICQWKKTCGTRCQCVKLNQKHCFTCVKYVPKLKLGLLSSTSCSNPDRPAINVGATRASVL